MLERLKEQLKRHEGVRLRPYRDTVGKWTIGVGRNLTDVGLSGEEIDLLLQNDVLTATEELDHMMPWWRSQSEDVQLALANMCFNMGITRLLQFKKFFDALRSGNMEQARHEMLDSLWADQVGHRALELADLIYPPVVK